MKKKTLSLLLAAALALGMVGCGERAAASSASSASSAAVSVVQSTVDLTDVTASFVFADGGVTAVSGTDGYKLEGTELTINAPGSYLVSGECANGSIKVKKGTTDVTLILNGLTLTATDTAPITCAKSTGVTIHVVEGTVNTLTDSEKNNDDNFPDNENAENAVIKCKDGSQVVLEGTGTLNLVAKGKNGMKSGCELDGRAASLTIRELTLDIDAPVNDAVNAEQLLNVESGTLTIFAGDDALHSDLVLNVGAEGTAGPTIDITNCEEGIEGAELNIFSGNISIRANDDCLNAANSDLGDYAFKMNISGGNITAYSVAGDGFDSNGDLTISGGTVVVWTASTADNQPLDADGTVSVTGGTVLAAGGSGGMGSTIVTEQGCVIYGSSIGDKMGGFGGGRGGMMQPQGEQPADMPQMPDGAPNDQMTPPDGTALPEIPQNEGEAPQQPTEQENFGLFDKREQPDDQGGFGGFGNFGGERLLNEGEEFSIVSADGTIVYSGTAMCDMSYLFFSSAEVQTGSEYTITAKGAEVSSATATSGTVAGGMTMPGAKLTAVVQTVSSWFKK